MSSFTFFIFIVTNCLSSVLKDTEFNNFLILSFLIKSNINLLKVLIEFISTFWIFIGKID